MSTRKCLQCGNEFDAVRNTQKFCSQKCKDTYHNTRKTENAIEKAGLENQQPTKVYVSAEWVNALQGQLKAANENNINLLAMFQEFMGISITAVGYLIREVNGLIGDIKAKRAEKSGGTTYSFFDTFELSPSIDKVNNAISVYNDSIQNTELFQRYYNEDDEYEDDESEDEDDEYEDEDDEYEDDDTEESGANW